MNCAQSVAYFSCFSRAFDTEFFWRGLLAGSRREILRISFAYLPTILNYVSSRFICHRFNFVLRECKALICRQASLWCTPWITDIMHSFRCGILANICENLPYSITVGGLHSIPNIRWSSYVFVSELLWSGLATKSFIVFIWNWVQSNLLQLVTFYVIENP
jgi:hypothetical protein